MIFITNFAWAQQPPPAENPEPSEPSVEAAEEGEGQPQPEPPSVPEGENPEALGGEEPEEIVVTGTRTPRPLGTSPVAVEVIGQEEIARSGAYDAAELLENQGGMDVVRDQFGATVRLRGLNANQTLVLVDGQRLVGRTGGATDLSRIPVEDIERIEIVKGPASALYGSDALGGVVQIVTRRARQPQASVGLRGGTLMNLDATSSVSMGTKKVGARLTGGWHGSPPIDRDPSSLATNLDGERQGQVSGRLDLQPSPDVSLPISGQYSLSTTGGIDQQGLAILDRKNVTQDARLLLQPSLTGERSRSSAHLGVSVYRDQFLSDQRESSALDELDITREAVLQLGLQRDQVAGQHLLSVGAEGFAEWMASDRLEDGTGNRLRGAIFAQDEWKLASWLVAVPSGRVDADSQFGVVPTPRLALRSDPVDTLTLRGSVGTGFRAPTFRELYLRFDNAGVGYRVEGNPDLQPERSATVDGAVEWVPAEVAALSLSGWWTEVSDLIDYRDQDGRVPDPGNVVAGTVFLYTNVDRATTRGFEVTASTDPTTRIHFSSAYTFTDARNRDTGAPLLGRAKHRVTLEGSVRGPSTELSLRGSVVGPRPFPDGTVPTYVLVDTKLGQEIGKVVKLVAGVDNVLDAGSDPLAPLAPRLFYAGVDVNIKRRTSKEE